MSPYQEYQMTSLGKNISIVEVDGTFDDCQKLVKKAFNDKELRNEMALSSANSINIARLLPQMLYYFFAYKQLKPKLNGKDLVVSVPSGNLGNLTAGLLAKRIGLPVNRFVSAHNANHTFHEFLATGAFTPKASVLTYSNAMDVGNPSNFERIEHLYQQDLNRLRADVNSSWHDDEATVHEIKRCYDENHYLADPHGAVGLMALKDSLKGHEVGAFLETAHPQKFSSVIQKAVPQFQAKEVSLEGCKKIRINNRYNELRKVLTIRN